MRSMVHYGASYVHDIVHVDQFNHAMLLKVTLLVHTLLWQGCVM